LKVLKLVKMKKKILKQREAQNIAISLGYFIFSKKSQNSFQKWPNGKALFA
jgi:hypothetical protein